MDNLNLPNDLTNTLEQIFSQIKQYDQSITKSKFIETIFLQWLEDYQYPKSNKEEIYTKNNSILRNNLKLAIEFSGKTQKQIANEIGINKNYLNQISTGSKYEPSVKVVLLLLKALNYHPKKLHDIFWLESLENAP